MNVALKHMTPDEFLVWCLDQPDRWELVHGVPIRMMTGATNGRDDIVVNLISELKARLKDRPCRVRTADVATRMATGNIRRPDVTIDRGPKDRRGLETSAPTAVFEVLSPSTRSFDLVRKPEEYRRLPTLRHITMIDPDMPRVWLLSRAGEDQPWTDQDVLGLDGVLELTALAISIPMSAVYEGVEFEG